MSDALLAQELARLRCRAQVLRRERDDLRTLLSAVRAAGVEPDDHLADVTIVLDRPTWRLIAALTRPSPEWETL